MDEDMKLLILAREMEKKIDEATSQGGPRYEYETDPVTNGHSPDDKIFVDDHFYTVIDDMEPGDDLVKTGQYANVEEDTIPDGVYASVIGAPGSGGGGGSSSADDVSYDNTDSGLTADNVQDAIDEVNAKVEGLDASDIAFDNTDTGMTADDVQEAIGELNSKIDDGITNGTSIANQRVDITPYTQLVSGYLTPCDGYLEIDTETSTTGWIRAAIADADGYRVAYSYINADKSGQYAIQSTFVRKGMRLCVLSKTASEGIVNFYPLDVIK